MNLEEYFRIYGTNNEELTIEQCKDIFEQVKKRFGDSEASGVLNIVLAIIRKEILRYKNFPSDNYEKEHYESYLSLPKNQQVFFAKLARALIKSNPGLENMVQFRKELRVAGFGDKLP